MLGKRGNKKGQLTIFIIIAIILVAVIVLIFLFTPAKQIFIPSKPAIQIRDCVKPELENAIENISIHGGSINPVNSYMYNGINREYLCYTNQYYKTCVMQQPLLRRHVEREILESVKPRAEQCLNDLKQDLKGRGYSINDNDEDVSIDIGRSSIDLTVSGFSIEKQESSERYNKFIISQNSQLYKLLMISTSILNWEARYGDSDITTYMMYYPNVKVLKNKQSDGTTIYNLTSRDTGDKFIFASRSIAWPAGYVLDREVYRPPQRNLNQENEK